MKLIKLNKGYYTKVDDEDFGWLNQWKWSVTFKNDKPMHVMRYKGIMMHRVILGLTNPKVQCDHKDHNGLNNQRSNLRTCTFAQNMSNRKSKKNSTSKYLGVTVRKVGSLSKIYYQVFIQKNNKKIYLGLFKDERHAAIQYDKAAIIYHGEFANLNILKIRNHG